MLEISPPYCFGSLGVNIESEMSQIRVKFANIIPLLVFNLQATFLLEFLLNFVSSFFLLQILNLYSQFLLNAPGLQSFQNLLTLIIVSPKEVSGILWIMHVIRPRLRPRTQRFSCVQPTGYISQGFFSNLAHA